MRPLISTLLMDMGVFLHTLIPVFVAMIAFSFILFPYFTF
jgi:hypothetical protein